MFFITGGTRDVRVGGHTEIRTQTGCVLSALPPAVGLCDLTMAFKFECHILNIFILCLCMSFD